MNIYQKITLGLSTVLLSGTAAANNFVMTSPADYRSYKSSQGEVVSVGIIETMGANWKQYSSFFGQQNQWLWVSNNGNQVYWLNESQELEMLLDSSDPVGTEYQVNIDGCTDKAVLSNKEASLLSAAGDFNDLVKLDFSGYCFDAGLKSAWFSPEVGLVKWTQDSVLGVVEFELEHAKVEGMTLPNQSGIELSAQFPIETVMLNQQKSVEASITLANHSSQTLTLDFTSGQTFEIYLYDDQDKLVTLWSSDRMFTQALHSMEIKPGEAERFGGELELKDLDGQPLDIGSYKIKIEIKGSLAPEASSFSHIPLSSESVLHLDNMMTHY